MAEPDTLPEPDRVEGAPHPRETLRLFGQERAEERFLAALASGRLHHGWLLAGPRGIGKATLAYRIARAIIGWQDDGLFGGGPPETLEMDVGNPVYRRVASRGEPRLRVLRRPNDPKTGRLKTVITVDEMREVKEFLQLSSPDGGWRVVLVDAAEDLNVSAANAFLKLLEEPPEKTLLLLVSHAPRRLLPTIRSRVRVLEMAELSPADLAAALEQTGAPVPAGSEAALGILSGGSVGEALRLLAVDGLAIYAGLVRLVDPNGIDRAALVRLAETAGGRDAEARYDAILRLTQMLVGRMARTAASGLPLTEAAPGEAALAAAVAAQQGQGLLWAEAAARIAAGTTAARAVNLDPAQVILDTFLDLDAVLRQARAAA